MVQIVSQSGAQTEYKSLIFSIIIEDGSWKTTFAVQELNLVFAEDTEWN